MNQYIFGYGSLMNSASRKLTGQTSEAIPATVDGLRRYWGKVGDNNTLSPLVVSQGQGKVNGVILQINDQELHEFDRRENGYQRIPLEHTCITSQLTLSTNDIVWIYTKDHSEPPCTLSPIMQTYVDTVLSGCLEISEDFAKQFIKQTIGWNFPIENDRLDPKYKNYAGVEEHHYPLIDKLVQGG